MERTRHLGRSVALTCIFLLVALSLPSSPLWAFNSEEHKLMGDWAVAEIRRDTSIELPWPTRFLSDSVSNLRYRAAKELAVGFQTNNQNDYSDEKKEVQDNSYWYAYAQRDGESPDDSTTPPGAKGNMNLWIPPLEYVRTGQLVVTGFVDTLPKAFTFGDLMSLYGDYRRTTFCTSDGTCFLTHVNTSRVNFDEGTDCFGVWPFDDCGWRPPETESIDYLRAIAAGLWPPYHTIGNLFENTAAEDDYAEAGWWGDEMIRIANSNDWHFSNGAIAWYVGMHRLALFWVNEAITRPDANGNLPNVKLWNNALHAEANALHSLTDLFAFGHVVTSRDVTSYEIMESRSLTTENAFLYMEHILRMGGGLRDSGDGQISLTDALPPISQHPQYRNDFMKTYVLGSFDGSWAKQEHQFHSDFNASGATVRNLRGDRYAILGDGDLRYMPDASKEVLKESVRTSIQNLFDAYVRIDRYGATVDELGTAGSKYFNALRYIPTYVESTPGGHFTGQWTGYTGMIAAVSGSDTVPSDWSECRMPYINGEVWDSELDNFVRSTPCSMFPTVATGTPPTEPQLISPADGVNGTELSVTFEWTPATDPDGSAVEYSLFVCKEQAFPASCGVSLVIPGAADQGSAAAAAASGLGLALFSALLVGRNGRHNRLIPIVILALVATLLLVSCGGNLEDFFDKNGVQPATVSFTRSDLDPATTYYWTVAAFDGNDASTSSATRSFVTR